MLAGHRVGQGVVVVVALVVVNVLLFLHLSGNEHLEPAPRVNRSAQAILGEHYAKACDQSPGARDSETALLLPKVSRGDTVIIAPGGGSVLAEGFYRHLGKDVALSLAFLLLDTRPQFAEAASRRADEEMDLFLRANSRMKHVNVAALTDVLLPPSSAAAVVVGTEVHYFGRETRSRFLAQMYDTLQEDGQLVMVDLAPTRDAIAFFQDFVTSKSAIGFRGEFLESDEMVKMLESVGYVEVSATDVEYDWRFGDENEMVQYICAVFALSLVDLESEKEVKQLLAAVAPLRRGRASEGVTLTWTATRYLAVKPGQFHSSDLVLSIAAIDDGDEGWKEPVEPESFQARSEEEALGQVLEETESLVAAGIAAFGGSLDLEEEAPLGKRAPAAGAASSDDWKAFKLRKETEKLVKEFEYVFKEEPAVELGRGSYAGCFGFHKFIPEWGSYIVRYFFVQEGWRDVSFIVMSLMDESTLSALTPSLAVYCRSVHARDPQDCFVKAVTGKGNSPLADLRVIYCYAESKVTAILRAFEKAQVTPPRRLHFLEAGLPWELEDKAGLLVAALQGAPTAVQERAMRHIPRTYLVAAHCASQVYDDQWDLWLEDYFGGDHPKMQSFAKQWPTQFQVGLSDFWRQGQPSIDLGKNLWISKPTLGLSFDISNTKLKAEIPMHEGKDVEVVRSPADFLELTNGATDPDCISTHRVLQKYVEQPMLWNGYKADFRLYVAVVSVKPPVYYLYTNQLVVRVARTLYSEEPSDDSSQHVTNLSRARKEDGADVLALGDDYITYLESIFPGRHVREEIFSGCEEMVAAVIPLVRLTEVARLGLGYGLTGWDVILDKDLKPWLMEVNRGCDWRTKVSAISTMNYLLWAQYLDLVFNYDVDTYPDRLGGFRKVVLPND